MENKISQTLFMAIILSANFLIPSIVWSAEAKESKPLNKDLDKELLKKYGSYRPKEILYLKDSMAVSERIDLDNKYFKISYPKCFQVEPTVEDSDDVTIKNSASIDFTRSKNCSLYSPKNDEADFNRMQLFYDSHFIEPKLLEKLERASKKAYRQMVDINTFEGVIYWGAGISPRWNIQGELVSGWNVVIGCKGKKNELFTFSIPGQRNKEVILTLKNKKFDLPEDFKQIISSFQCRKDR